jgi:sugar phosphate isomerase/epimerase
MPNSILRENKELLVDTKLVKQTGRYRSPGDGQVDFKTIFSKLSQYDFKGWAVMEWNAVSKIKKMVLAKVLNL